METTFSIAISTATALLGYTLSLICFRASLRLRKGVREEGPSFEPDSKRAKLDEAASSNPVAADLVPETETQEASYSEASDASHEWILSARLFGMLAAPPALKYALFCEYGISGFSRSDDFTLVLSSWIFDNLIYSKIELALLHRCRKKYTFRGLPLF